jgi:hypothetical protein
MGRRAPLKLTRKITRILDSVSSKNEPRQINLRLGREHHWVNLDLSKPILDRFVHPLELSIPGATNASGLVELLQIPKPRLI